MGNRVQYVLDKELDPQALAESGRSPASRRLLAGHRIVLLHNFRRLDRDAEEPDSVRIEQTAANALGRVEIHERLVGVGIAQ